jgi:hypothetical protein
MVAGSEIVSGVVGLAFEGKFLGDFERFVDV